MINKIPKRWRSLIIFVALLMAPILLIGRGNWILFFDSPIEGYVVDAETGKPLEGVIVAGLWELTQFPSHGSGGYAKISMEITDKEGMFKIPFWITFKPWTFYSSMDDITPTIVVYKPGYKFHTSNIVMRAGFPGDISKTQEEKKRLKEEYSVNPVKLKRIYSDEERIQNYYDWGTIARFPGWHYSRKQTRKIYGALREEISHLPKEKANKYNVGTN
jgi:hypothetical protein